MTIHCLHAAEWVFISRRCKLKGCHLKLTDATATRILRLYQENDGQHPAQQVELHSLVADEVTMGERVQAAALSCLAANGSLQHLETLSVLDVQEERGDESAVNPLLAATLDLKVSYPTCIYVSERAHSAVPACQDACLLLAINPF